jgi:hypothetical protein
LARDRRERLSSIGGGRRAKLVRLGKIADASSQKNEIRLRLVAAPRARSLTAHQSREYFFLSLARVVSVGRSVDTSRSRPTRRTVITEKKKA